ncbi:UNKNOWN [Stylonychia lemnae]|uniref:Amino acid transporter transmembrane domain-containing protein n=1 Tax=Stylonychia lemnae TaxID=5949 RepID=A0A078AS89_STYLE|nr:UNKNOWN [Stylonychia lemnae]|eukprot:CDW85330.1 UNKNOWN [Stylonychia lemnae]
MENSRSRIGSTFLNISNLDLNLSNLQPQRRGSYYDPFESSILVKSRQTYSDMQSPLLGSKKSSKGGLSISGAALSFISTIIGAGIVSLPYVILQAGYLYGIMLHILMIFILLFAVYLLLVARQNLGYESFGEIAYICLGKPSIYVINFVITAATSLIVTMYALLFSNICVSFSKSVFGDTSNSDYLIEYIVTTKVFYIVALYIILLPFVMKRSFKELKLTSILLIFGVISMLVIFFAKAFFKSYFVNESDQKVEIYQKGSIVDSIFIVLTAYGFILNFYPIFAQLEVRSNKNGYLSTLMAMLFCFITYLLFSYFAMETYGEYLNPNIFENIQVETNIPSYFIRFIFLAIFICNIPFIFLPGKECLLMMIDEALKNTISKQIEIRIATLRAGNVSLNISRLDEEVNGAQIALRVSTPLYISYTIGLFSLQMLLAVLIDDITLIFGFFAAISESTINFILPGLFYIISFKIAGKKPNIWAIIGSYIYVVVGIFLFFFANYNNIIKITSSPI